VLRAFSWLLEYGCVAIGDWGRVSVSSGGVREGLGWDIREGIGERENWVRERGWVRRSWCCRCRWWCPSIVTGLVY
jgi:hypothetical protein